MVKIKKLALLVGLGSFAFHVLAEELPLGDVSTNPVSNMFSYRGYLREYLSVNLDDNIVGPSGQMTGKGELSMARTVLRLDGAAKLNEKLSFVGTVRVVREVRTDYMKDLDNAAAQSSVFSGFYNKEKYNENELREGYFVLKPTQNISLKLGRQQVAWGETDFLRGTDIVHGFDYRWRSLLESENEELRTPLVMANAEIYFPKVDGTLQLLYRPGWDKGADVVNKRDLFGGRWAGQPNKGINNLDAAPYNYHHSEGDTKDANWGFRWSSKFSDTSYSLMYYKGLSLDPVVNSIAMSAPGSPGSPLTSVPVYMAGSIVNSQSYGSAPANGFLESIFPRIETIGATLNTYFEKVDGVVRGELAYVPNQPFNVGSRFNAIVGAPITIGAIPGLDTLSPGCAPPPGAPCLTFPTVVLPGAGGIIKKHVMNTMVGFDKTLPLQNIFGTSRPSTFSVQLFDTWITNFDEKDDIVDLFSYGAKKKRHSTTLSSALINNYRYDTINVGLAVIYDVTWGDTILIPSIEFAPGDKWRFRVEGDFTFAKNSDIKTRGGQVEDSTHPLGTGKNNDQLYFRATYQF